MGNLAVSGLMLLTFMTIHLFQFRFGDTEQFGPYYLRPPRYLINFWGILSLNLFCFLHLLCDHLHGPCMPRVEEGRSCLGHSEVARCQRRKVWLCYFLCDWIHLHLFPALRDVHPAIR